MSKYIQKQLVQDILKQVAKGVVEYFIVTILYFAVVFIIAANFQISSSVYIIVPFVGIFLSLLCIFTAYKIENIKYVFLKLSFAVLGISTAHIFSGYFVQFVPKVMEVIVLHHIIIIYLYFIVLSLLYNIVYVYVYNKSIYFNRELSFNENLKYFLLYFILGFLPFLLCYLILIGEPIIYVFILLSSTIIIEIITNINSRRIQYIENKSR